MMEEKTLHIEVPLLLPDVTDQEDGCLERLERALKNHKGILQVQILNHRSPMILHLQYNPAEVSLETIHKISVRAGADITNRYHHETLQVEGMDCSDCVVVLEHGIRRTSGVLNASVNYATQTLLVEYDATRINRMGLQRRIRQLGYQVPARGVQSWLEKNRELISSLAGGMLLLAAWVGQTFLSFPPAVIRSLYALAYLAAGWEISLHAWHAIRERQFDTDLLMFMAALGAVSLGEISEGALLLFLFSMGHALEERALARARGAIRALGNLMPKTTLARRDGQTVQVSVDHLKLNEVVVVQPGVRIPVDGAIISGQSAIDQSPVTGESIPVDKKPGDNVYAGTVNGEGALEVQVNRLAKDSTLARVIHMVEEAQAQKSPTQQIVERFMRWFIPAVLIGVLLLIAVPPFFGVPFRTAFMRAMTLLVAASPCALALGTPSAILSGIARAARGGVLVKGGMHLENLGRVSAIAFDKTGTITRGRPEVVDIFALDPASPDEVIGLAGAVESWSGHPLAQAVVRKARERKITLPEVNSAIATTGQGIQALAGEKLVRVGNLRFFAESGIEIAPEIVQQVKAYETQGKTTMVVWKQPTALGVITVADSLRDEAGQAIAGLRQCGVQRTVMLTGDQSLTAEYIAGLAGIQEVKAGLLPEDKLAVVRDLVRDHGCVAMVGDGVNDAPALALATVGIAMGGSGTDVALETADVALVGDDLNRLPFAVRLGKSTRQVIYQNLFIALAVIGLLMFSATLGWISIGPAVIFHESSTIVVALNSLRLLSHRG